MAYAFNRSVPDFIGLCEKYKCPLCKEVLKDPMQTTCGHRFCKTCLEEYVNTQGNGAQCPEGECGPISLDDGVYSDRYMVEEIRNLLVFCPYKEEGCDVQIPWKNLESHLEECGDHQRSSSQGLKDCILKGVGCPFRGNSEALTTHDNEAETDHIRMIAKCTAQKEEAQKKTNQRVQKLIADQGAKIIVLGDEKASKMDVANLAGPVVNIQQSQQQMNMMANTLGSIAQRTRDERRHQEQRHDQMVEIDRRFQILETTSYEGKLIWKIKDYQRRKQDAINGCTLSLYSQPFFTERYGYKVCARVYLNGDGVGKETHLSIFFVVMKGEYDAVLSWPFQKKITLTLMDQSGAEFHISDSFKPDPSSSSFQKPVAEMNVSSGCPKFVAHSTLENGSYIEDDTLFIKVQVE